jgi:hypothetical protein
VKAIAILAIVETNWKRQKELCDDFNCAETSRIISRLFLVLSTEKRGR